MAEKRPERPICGITLKPCDAGDTLHGNAVAEIVPTHDRGSRITVGAVARAVCPLSLADSLDTDQFPGAKAVGATETRQFISDFQGAEADVDATEAINRVNDELDNAALGGLWGYCPSSRMRGQGDS